jgi:uncharacterized protein YhaN
MLATCRADMEASLSAAVEGMGLTVMSHFGIVASQPEITIESSNFEMQAQLDSMVLDQARAHNDQAILKQQIKDFEKQFQEIENRFKTIETAPPPPCVDVVPLPENTINEELQSNPTILRCVYPAEVPRDIVLPDLNK